MSIQISESAVARREQNRRHDGRFGVDPAAEADVTLDALDALDEPLEDEPEDGFEFSRISSLMGDAYHLDPERKVALPRINEDDTIAQIHHKLNRYLAKTQDVTDLTDEQVATDAGFQHDPDAEMATDLRNSFGISEGDRVVVAEDSGGNPVYISAGNTAKKTGHYLSRATGANFRVVNIAERTIQPTMKQEFAEEHPDLDAKTVDQLFRRLNGNYRGKGHRYLWSEATLSRRNHFMLSMARTKAGLSDTPMTDDATAEWLASLPRAEDGRAVITGPRGQALLDTRDIEEDLAGTSPHSDMVAANRAYRRWITERMADEHDFTLQRKYVHDNSGGGGARVFEQKKNVPQSHLDAAENSTFRTSGDFRHVEVDADTDLDKLAHVGAEYEALRRHLPQTQSTPALRFRKTGRHQAMGVYHPHVDNIAVDPRHPSSFAHEYAHHIDHTAGDRNLSSEDDFKPILRAVQRAVSASHDPVLNKKIDYHRTPTEIHARSLEAYLHWKNVETSLNGEPDKYATDPAYTTLAPMKDQIITYWDAKLTELGAEPPVSRGR